ncbi:MAG: hypothetical protein ACREAA_10060 [Candidatus Polarisedimenticolia bacterium]
MARKQRRQDKAAKKAEIRQLKQHIAPDATELPDAEISGIRPGPQPVPAWVRSEPGKP